MFMNISAWISLFKLRKLHYSLLKHVTLKQECFHVFFSVLGCSDVNTPDYTWYKRDGNSAVVGCDNSEDEWLLRCEGSRWVGVVGNCTKERKFLLISMKHNIWIDALISANKTNKTLILNNYVHKNLRRTALC